MCATRPLVLLLQLPIPPPGFVPVRGNVPLAAGYLKLFARRRGLEDRCRVELLRATLANTLGDQGLVQAILVREPWLVGLTCYVWNIERSLWVAQQLKQRRPDLLVVLGGPEMAIDNRWVLEHAAVDYAVLGEGEQTFAELLARLLDRPADPAAIAATAGLWSRAGRHEPSVRRPLSSLEEISSPYLEGILDAADDETMLLETTRGCRFKCKFCYYPKSYDRQYFLSEEKVRANLAYAVRRGVKEVFLLDPTLNQRPDFARFLRVLREGNPDRQFTYSAELRAEGVTAQTARLLRAANFTEIEVGLQSVDPLAQSLVARKVPLAAFQRGVRAMRDEGIDVKIDLIVGLPGDSPDSVRRGFDYLQQSGLCAQFQVFNLSILPGTALRAEAEALGLRYQPRPPYYVLSTPRLSLEEIVSLVEESQQRFGVEFDPLPAPVLEPPQGAGDAQRMVRVDLDGPPYELPGPERRAQTFAIWLRARDFHLRRAEAAELVGRLLADNPHGTLQVIVEPTGEVDGRLDAVLDTIHEACFRSTSYLDRYYSLTGGSAAAKRIVLLLPGALRSRLGAAWIAATAQRACILWGGGGLCADDLEGHEYLCS